MISLQERDEAAHLLKAALQHPDTVDPADLDVLSKTIEDFDSGETDRSKSKGEVQLPETTVTGSPSTALALEPAKPSMVPGFDQIQAGLQQSNPILVARPNARPSAALRANYATSSYPPSAYAEYNPDTDNAQAFEDQKKAIRADLYDTNLPTASKLKTASAPPEYFPPETGREDLALPRGNRGGYLTKSMPGMHGLPSAIGGDVDYIPEPSIEQFRRDMRRNLGDAVDRMDQNSEAYQLYADQLWSSELEKAKTEGRAVVRTAYNTHKNWKDDVASGVATGVRALESGVHGYVSGLTGGLVTGGQAGQARDEEFGPLHTAGEAIGTLSPGGVAGLALHGLGAAGKFVARSLPGQLGARLGQWAAGGVGRAATSVGKAAGAGLAQTAAELGGEAIDTGQMPERVGGRLLTGAGTGALIGGGAHLVGEIAGAGVRGLRRDNPALAEAENASARTNTLTGIKRGPRLQPLYEEAAARNPGAPNPGALRAEQLVEPMREEGAKLLGETEASIASDMDAYGKTAGGRSKQQMHPVTSSALDLLREGTDANFANKPMTGLSDTNDRLRRVVRESAEPRLVRLSGAAEVDASQARWLEAQQRLAKAQQGLDDAIAFRKMQGSAPLPSPNMLPGKLPTGPAANTGTWAAGPEGQVGANATQSPKIGGTAKSADAVDRARRNMLQATRDANAAEREFADVKAHSSLSTHPEMVAIGQQSARAEAAWGKAGPPPEVGTARMAPLTPVQAANLGFDIEGLVAKNYPQMAKAMEKMTPAQKAAFLKRQGFNIMLVPAFGDASAVERGIREIDDMASAMAKQGPDRAYAPLVERARSTRGQFPPHGPAELSRKGAPREISTKAGKRKVEGYEAMRAGHADLQQETQNTLEAAGLPKNVPMRLDENEIARAQGAIGQYHGGRAPRKDTSLNLLAQRAGILPQLQDVSAANAVEDLRKVAWPNAAARLSLAGRAYGMLPVTALRLRLDPTLRRLSTSRLRGGQVGALAGLLPNPLSPGMSPGYSPYVTEDEADAIAQASENLRKLNVRPPRGMTP